MGKARDKERWSVEKRLEYIDFRLYWEGHINRGDLVEHFEISVPQASADLTLYQEQAAGNAVYDKTLKTYVAGPGFRPVFFEPSADRYLAQLRLVGAGLLAEGEAWATPEPAVAIVPALRRTINPLTLRRLLAAIRDRAAVHVTYQSIKCPDPRQRWVSPHALGFDGFRWYARAWCHRRSGFVDFVLARVLAVGETRGSEVNPDDDVAWKREITLRFEPHPDLAGGARKAIELDYGMTNGFAEITTRLCLTYYLERQFGIDAEAPKSHGVRQQLVLVNHDELIAAREEVGDACGLDPAAAGAEDE